MRPSTRRRPTTKPSVAQIYRPKETPRHKRASKREVGKTPGRKRYHTADHTHKHHGSANSHSMLHTIRTTNTTDHTRARERHGANRNGSKQRLLQTRTEQPIGRQHAHHRKRNHQHNNEYRQRLPAIHLAPPSRASATHTERAGAFVAPTLALRYYRKFYSPSAFFSADTRRRLTGIFSSTPLSVSSSVPPATGSISSTMDRFTR